MRIKKRHEIKCEFINSKVTRVKNLLNYPHVKSDNNIASGGFHSTGTNIFIIPEVPVPELTKSYHYLAKLYSTYQSDFYTFGL